jgi:hypothetical protein
LLACPEPHHHPHPNATTTTAGAAESLERLLAAAVARCPGAEILWLVWAKEKWGRGDVVGAREVLVDAFKVGGHTTLENYHALLLPS